MNLTLTQKERTLLEDQKNHENICIKKYNSYANQAQDPELKQMFQTYAQQEQQHLNTINQMLNGQVPAMQQNQQQQQQGQQQQMQQQQQSRQGQQQNQQFAGMVNSSDADLCTDMLMTEKYVSSAYNTAVFEFVDTNARQALNHIQKEEQQHGEGIFNYMKKKGLYQMQ
ncbi:MAG: spore coat protein [Caldicoprobacterales bacterium]|jgi:spore coat protein CotF|nr:spore coat protein [Clostridiales bacterium]